MEPTTAPDLASQLKLAERALAVGDFGGARRLLLRLGREVHSDEERAAVDALLYRLSPDPVAAVLLSGCLLLFVAVLWVTLH